MHGYVSQKDKRGHPNDTVIG